MDKGISIKVGIAGVRCNSDIQLQIPKGMVLDMAMKSARINIKNTNLELNYNADGGEVNLSEVDGNLNVTLYTGTIVVDSVVTIGNFEIKSGGTVKLKYVKLPTVGPLKVTGSRITLDVLIPENLVTNGVVKTNTGIKMTALQSIETNLSDSDVRIHRK